VKAGRLWGATAAAALRTSALYKDAQAPFTVDERCAASKSRMDSKPCTLLHFPALACTSDGGIRARCAATKHTARLGDLRTAFAANAGA
jgi:hypothetical protein